MALGVALLGLVGVTAYRAQVTVPSGVPAEQAETARTNIAGAVVAAEEVPGPAGAALFDSAREAFTTGLHLVAAIAAVVLAGRRRSSSIAWAVWRTGYG